MKRARQESHGASSSSDGAKRNRSEASSSLSSSASAASSSSSAAASSSSSSSSSSSTTGEVWRFVQDKGRRKKIYTGYRGIDVQLQNLVATTDLRSELNLETIQHQVRNAEYNPAKFAACVIRIREPRTTALVFASGKMVVTGAGCWEDAKRAAIKFGRAINKLGFDVSLRSGDLALSNIVASCDVKFAIKLEGLAYEHGTSANYEPELFPGLIYRMQVPKVVLLIFVSGKVVMTGAKTVADILRAFEVIYPVLYKYRKQGSGENVGGGAGGASGGASGAASSGGARGSSGSGVARGQAQLVGANPGGGVRHTSKAV